MGYVPKGALCAATLKDGKPCLNVHYKKSKYCIEHYDNRGGQKSYPEVGSLDLAQVILHCEPLPQRLRQAEPVKLLNLHTWTETITLSYDSMFTLPEYRTVTIPEITRAS